MSLRNGRLRRLRSHRVPPWWLDAKLGIFMHWTTASVPAFAPVDVDIGALVPSGATRRLARSPYAEWYENSLRFPDSPVARHHRETFGERPLRVFRGGLGGRPRAVGPRGMGRRVRASGARYVVFVTKHMDGYCLWPTDIANPNRPGWQLPP